MRTKLLTLSVLAAVSVGTLVAQAGTTVERTPVNCSDAVSRTTSVSTSSTTWEDVPGLVVDPVAIFPISIDVSASVSGAPVRFRVLSTNIGNQTFVSDPGATRFDPGPKGANAFSYRWVERNDVAAAHANHLVLQWRSPSGAEVSLLRGVLTATYTTDACTGSS
jgi:hypothetical protein